MYVIEIKSDGIDGKEPSIVEELYDLQTTVAIEF